MSPRSVVQKRVYITKLNLGWENVATTNLSGIFCPLGKDIFQIDQLVQDQGTYVLGCLSLYFRSITRQNQQLFHILSANLQFRD